MNNCSYIISNNQGLDWPLNGASLKFDGSQDDIKQISDLLISQNQDIINQLLELETPKQYADLKSILDEDKYAVFAALKKNLESMDIAVNLLTDAEWQANGFLPNQKSFVLFAEDGTPIICFNLDTVDLSDSIHELLHIVFEVARVTDKEKFDNIISTVKSICGQEYNAIVSGVVGDSNNMGINVQDEYMNLSYDAIDEEAVIRVLVDMVNGKVNPTKVKQVLVDSKCAENLKSSFMTAFGISKIGGENISFIEMLLQPIKSLTKMGSTYFIYQSEGTEQYKELLKARLKARHMTIVDRIVADLTEETVEGSDEPILDLNCE